MVHLDNLGEEKMGRTYWPWELKNLPASRLRRMFAGVPMWPWEVRVLREAERKEELEQRIATLEREVGDGTQDR